MGTFIRWVINWGLKLFAVAALGTAAGMICQMGCAVFFPMETETFINGLKNVEASTWLIESISALFPSLTVLIERLKMVDFTVKNISIDAISTPIQILKDMTNGIVLAVCAGAFSQIYNKVIAHIIDSILQIKNWFADWITQIVIMAVSILMARILCIPVYKAFEFAAGISSVVLIQNVAACGVFIILLLGFVLILKIFNTKYAGWGRLVINAFGKILIGAIATALTYLLAMSMASVLAGVNIVQSYIFLIICPIILAFLFSYMAIAE